MMKVYAFCGFICGIVWAQAEGLTCFCESPDCGNNDTCYIDDGVCFESVQRMPDSGNVYTNRRCITSDELSKKIFLCRESANRFLTMTCCKSDYCNGNVMTLPPPTTVSSAGITNYLLAVILSCIAAALLVLVVIVYILIRRHQKCSKAPETPSPTNSISIKNDDLEVDMKEPFDDWSSGSGAGQPLLVQRTIARQVQLLEVIGKGRYGEVYRGKWRGDENIAVKKFTSRDERSWFREAEIYQTTMLRHDNILGFIAADNKDGGTWTELWLLTEYHENGSLFDYLGSTHIDQVGLFKLTISIASGLEHLHMEIVGTQGKPPIAHRDLKSKNILVKKNGECAIADLGLAVRHDSASDTIDIPFNNKVGTIRYMAPEVLNETLNMRHFDSFKRADIYSFGLVIWEIARRCTIGGQSLKYELPYFDMAPNDPTIEDMRAVVCVKKSRPTSYPLWESNDCLLGIHKIMCECWYENGCARPTALRVKKDLKQLRDEECVKIV